MSHGETHQVFRRELAEAAHDALGFAENFAAVRAAKIRRQQNRHRVPAVRLHFRRRAVVARDDQHVRVEFRDSRNDRVQLLGPLHFGREVAVLAGGICVFEWTKKKS